MNISDLIGLIAEDCGWEVTIYKPGPRSRVTLRKEGKKKRTIWFEQDEVFICQAKTCNHDHKHNVSVHDPDFEETVKSWFPFFELREDKPAKPPPGLRIIK